LYDRLKPLENFQKSRVQILILLFAKIEETILVNSVATRKTKMQIFACLAQLPPTSARRASECFMVLIQLCYPEYLVKANNISFQNPRLKPGAIISSV
jgi:hypothetical protein